MRSFYAEAEILVAEVQTLYQDGAFGVHTRNLRYGKLVTGELLTVQPSLVRRSRSHFVLFEWGVEVILGLNGFIWVGKPRPPADEQDLETIYSLKLAPVTREERIAITRTRNCLLLLDRTFHSIEERTISALYKQTISMAPTEILSLEESLVANLIN